LDRRRAAYRQTILSCPRLGFRNLTFASVLAGRRGQKTPSIFLTNSDFDLKPVWERAMSEVFSGEWHELAPWVKKQLGAFEPARSQRFCRTAAILP